MYASPFVELWGTGAPLREFLYVDDMADACVFLLENYSGEEQFLRAIDLGLPSGTLWASMNLGATAPEETGDFFAFAELEPKENYGSSNWRYFDKDNYLILTYNLWEDWGDLDFRAIQDPADDAAHVILGSDWRTPTMEELTELRTECEITNVTLNGVSVRKFTGPTGNCIYIPNAGYMSGTHRTYENDRPILASSSVVISQDNM